VPISGKLTINELLNGARRRMGDQKFYEYEGFNNNCQTFIMNILAGAGLMNADRQKFIQQDLSDFVKESEHTKVVADTLTYTAGLLTEHSERVELFRVPANLSSSISSLFFSSIILTRDTKIIQGLNDTPNISTIAVEVFDKFPFKIDVLLFNDCRNLLRSLRSVCRTCCLNFSWRVPITPH